MTKKVRTPEQQLIFNEIKINIDKRYVDKDPAYKHFNPYKLVVGKDNDIYDAIAEYIYELGLTGRKAKKKFQNKK